MDKEAYESVLMAAIYYLLIYFAGPRWTEIWTPFNLNAR